MGGHVLLLGAVRYVSPDGETIDVPSQSQRRLLAVLALSAGRSVRADFLGEVMGLGPSALRTLMSRLRATLGSDDIRTVPSGYLLEAGVDAARFEELACGTMGLGGLDLALSLWTGDALEEFAEESWALAEASRLEELRRTVIEDRSALLTARGRGGEAIATLTALIETNPYRDRARGLLIEALAAEGRQAEALRAYQEYRAFLAEETGTDPSDYVKDIEREVANGVAGFQPSLHERSGNLPMQTTSLIGRDSETVEVAELVRAHRLVTLTGVGGVGKTQLALRVASMLGDDFSEGVWLVELGPISRPGSIPDAAATSLGVTTRTDGAVVESVTAALAERDVLIVLDNCEHVLDEAAAFVDAVLLRTPSVRVVATSRESLRVPGERVWPVPPLDATKGVGSAAVELFVDRAQAADQRFELGDATEAFAAIEVCRRLDGIPLAIELAAARMGSMSPTELMNRLDDRFRLLTGSPRTPERQRTLYKTVEWSYDLLEIGERVLLERCSIFAGGFDLAAAVHLGLGDDLTDEYQILEVLDSLARKSLVNATRWQGKTRFTMLETIRQFANERLAENSAIDELRDRHATHFSARALQWLKTWEGTDQRAAIDWTEVEFANLRVGFQWSSQRADVGTATTIAALAAMMSRALQNYEPVEWVEAMLDDAVAADVAQLPRLYTAACLCQYVGRPHDAIGYARRALQLEADPRYESFQSGWSAFWESTAHLYTGDSERCLAGMSALASAEGLEKVMGLAGLMFVLPAVGRANEVLPIAERALDAARANGNPMWIGFALAGYGRAFTSVDPDRALMALRQGLDYSARHRLPFIGALIARDAASLEAAHGDPLRALELFETTIVSFRDAGDHNNLVSTLAYLAVALAGVGRLEAAATLHGHTSAHASLSTVVGADSTAELLRRQFDGSAFDRATAIGRSMDLKDAVRYARDQIDVAMRTLSHGSAPPDDTKPRFPAGLGVLSMDVVDAYR